MSDSPDAPSFSEPTRSASAHWCPLCASAAGEPLFSNDLLRVVLPAEPDYPGFVRVILNRHVAEMTDLPEADRDRLMRVVWQVESAVRESMVPDKVNVASLGNMVPHVHWHVIPRWKGDRHFPGSVWSAPQRAADAPLLDASGIDLRAQMDSRVDKLRRSLERRLALKS